MKYDNLIHELGKINATVEQREVLDEAMDIIHDYELAAETAARLTTKYETEKNAIQRGSGAYSTWQCPSCQNFIAYGNEHCHWCGQRLGWSQRHGSKRKR